MRIFLAGFHHETNTFAPSVADWAAFEAGAGYPAYARGEAMLEQMAGGSLAIAGFVREARARGWTPVPSVWAGAMPSNRITADAFARIRDEMLADLREALREGLDGILLDLHGAAVAEGADDAEGELLACLRAAAGSALPIVASLDLHANVTRRMLTHASAMTAYRTYPHVDMMATGERAARMLARRLKPGAPARLSHARRVPFLLPLNAQCTLMEPAASVIARVERLETMADLELSFAMGFSAADFAECGPVLFGHGADAAALRRAVDALHEEVCARRREWSTELLAPAEAVVRALSLAGPGRGPVVMADTQDNPGAGGDANTTGMLHALRAAGTGHVLGGAVALGLLFDPDSAGAACAAGVGARLNLSLGRAVPTWDGTLTDAPWRGEARVLAVHDGNLPLHGPMTAGATARLGPCACVEIEGIRVLLSSAKAQMLDLDLFRFLGVEPGAMRLLVVKSSVHFRAAFAPIASHILVAKAPGPMPADPGDLPWRHLDPATSPRP
ncbi:M81 family metallopeptidase [Piscinibacter sp.]|uniref:M81 family metallopeptidase n=1 Tax=Piscinibacter sp. TaxID=1903157 RepID=UPI001DF1AA44|nr:M81 family metallopeptidase [Piscinibacter sp.]MBK7531756.1 M81 family metallopeptidase [Piscinibacter sp.]